MLALGARAVVGAAVLAVWSAVWVGAAYSRFTHDSPALAAVAAAVWVAPLPAYAGLLVRRHA